MSQTNNFPTELYENNPSGTTHFPNNAKLEVIRAGIPGRCFKCSVREGDVLEAGDDVLWIESNKMEIRVASPVSGRVAGLGVSVGDLVLPEDALVFISQ
jgi:urea carboxylase/allophanate hydrolase